MGVIQSAYKRKRRNAEDRKRRPIVFLIAEGKNKTETFYFKAFGHDMNRNVRFAPGDYTDPVNMVSTLKNFMADNDFSPELGDKAYCLIDADVDAVKNAQLEKAARLAERFNIQIIVSAPSFEYWFICHFIFTGKKYTSNSELLADLEVYVPGYKKSAFRVYDLLKSKVSTATKNARMIEKKLLADGEKIHTVSFTPSSEAYYIAEELSK